MLVLEAVLGPEEGHTVAGVVVAVAVELAAELEAVVEVVVGDVVEAVGLHVHPQLHTL